MPTGKRAFLQGVAFWGVVLGLCYLGLRYALPCFLPLVLGAIMAAALHPAAAGLCRRLGWRYRPCAVLVAVAALTLLGLMLWGIGGVVVRQGSALLPQIPAFYRETLLPLAEELREKYPERTIYVVDTLCASRGEGLLVWYACKKRDEGMTLDELHKWVEDTKLHLCHWFTVDDLNYLKMGGRLSAGAAFFGSMLSIKPVMHTSDEGKLVPVSKVRGRKASLKALIDKIAELGIEPSEQVMFICHADCEVEARAVAEEMKARYGVKEVYINYIGPVIGSHTGPNTMGIFFVGTKR